VGASWAERVGPVVHELVDDKLRPSVEQIDQRFGPFWRIEVIAIVIEFDHRETPTASGDPVKETGGLLFRNEQLVVFALPLLG
jgi:hypothetical protein